MVDSLDAGSIYYTLGLVLGSHIFRLNNFMHSSKLSNFKFGFHFLQLLSTVM